MFLSVKCLRLRRAKGLRLTFWGGALNEKGAGFVFFYKFALVGYVIVKFLFKRFFFRSFHEIPKMK